MPALHDSPESRASSLSLFRYPTTPSRGCETGRQRAHRIGSSMYPHLSSTLSPTYRASNLPDLSLPATTLNPPHLSLARSLFLRASSSGRSLVTVVPCYVMSRLVHVCSDHRRPPPSPPTTTLHLIVQSLDVIILHSLFRLVSFPRPPTNPSKSFKRSSTP